VRQGMVYWVEKKRNGRFRSILQFIRHINNFWPGEAGPPVCKASG